LSRDEKLEALSSRLRPNRHVLTGAILNETKLTPPSVNVQHFGKIFTLHADGDVYAQLLFLGGVEIPGKGRHDVLFIATEHDSIYAFDAYGNPSTPLWVTSFLKDGFTTVPAGDADCPFISPEIGITSTPVIDPDTGRLYVLARAKDRSGFFESTYAQRLHALAVTTDVEKFGGPVEIPTATPRIRITEGKGGRIAAPGLSGSGRVWVMAIRRGSLWGC